MDLFEEAFRRVRGSRQPDPLEVILVGVTGHYSAGKTYFSRQFAEWLDSRGIAAHHVEGDMYFKISKPERNRMLESFEQEGTYEQRLPEVYALEESLMVEHLRMMKERRDIHKEGLYQRTTGEKNRVFDIRFDERPAWVLYDGIWGIQEPFRNFMDFFVFLTAEKDVRMARAGVRAATSGNAYFQKQKKFYGVDGFTGRILSENSSPAFLYIDNTNHNHPEVVAHDKVFDI